MNKEVMEFIKNAALGLLVLTVFMGIFYFIPPHLLKRIALTIFVLVIILMMSWAIGYLIRGK